MKNGVNSRLVKDKIFLSIVIFFSFLSILPLLFILFYIVKNGFGVLSLDFITQLPKPVGETGGGISNAIIGTFILIGIASILSMPLGIGIGIYLAENKSGKLPYIVRLCAEVLQGIPSIVIGIIAWIWIVVQIGSFSALSGGIALGMLMLPIIVRSTEETLKLIPTSLKEASLALGVPYYRTILKVVLPTGISGIVTGILLSISRVAGETAPLLFTAFGSPYMNTNIMKPVNSLPALIFNYATSPYEDWLSAAWGASLVLVLLVLILNFIAKVVTKKWKVQF
ncbi:MAG: phosphate ABC transporter permease PtsA [Candidatus Margulisiibacteriota bacterium]|nr:MAG: phosphate ABC transporter permease PtsA [Candidatus Margulisiibacteriota bacterium]HAR64561.1 phosphate ABC transporter permease PtsA [Candidatus Margulisiibacteriota bacterium]HCT84600.1 phosphate ABC transporter permease PtsA [Candidatus Margulisiibacteriota bacterium]HCY37115.1 phosphate ABC transporter permease PtsA [Candidatus Margulisiibacteriota bacterium]